MDAAGRSRLIGLIIGITLAFSLMHTIWFLWAPALLVVPVALGLLIGELTLPRPARAVGAATLRTRQVRDYVPRGAGVTIAAMLLALAASLLTPPWIQSDYVIWYYSGNDAFQLARSALATLAVVIGFSAVAVWTIVRSRAAGATEEQQVLDEAWRRRTVGTIAALAATLSSLAAAAALLWQAHGTLDWRGSAHPLLGVPLAALGVGSLFVFVWYAQRFVRAAGDSL
jgi:hypothetical protein